MHLGKIVVPTDFSPDARCALDLALELARGSGAQIVLLHVCHVPTYAFFTGGLFAPTRDLFERVIEDATEALRREQAERCAHGQTVAVTCLEGDPPETIVRWAAEQKADLIVMGTHGRRGLGRLLMGSVAEHVVRTASQPVLTVHARSPEEASAPTIQGVA